MKKIPFMDIPGSDPSAAMRGDKAQFVKGSTTPGSKVKKPQKVNRRGYVGQYDLPREKRSNR